MRVHLPAFRPGVPAMLQSCCAALAGCALSLPLAAADFVMIAPTDHTMPLAQFQDGQLSGGILKDLGDAIGERLGQRVRYLSVNGENVGAALRQGRADGLCYVLPEWIDGDFHWSSPLIANAELVVARDGAPAIGALRDLQDKPVGTVAAYRYPRLQQVLGVHFMRSDSATMDKNLRQMALGKFQYTVLDKLTLDYLQRSEAAPRLRADLPFITYKAPCAFARSSKVPARELDRVIDGLRDDGSLERILARYR